MVVVEERWFDDHVNGLFNSVEAHWNNSFSPCLAESSTFIKWFLEPCLYHSYFGTLIPMVYSSTKYQFPADHSS